MMCLGMIARPVPKANLTAMCKPDCLDDVGSSTSQNLMSPRPVTGIALLFLYVDDVRTSQETHLRASTACYSDGFT
jgi:hypothetical protein